MHIAVIHIFQKSRYTQNFARRWVTLWLRFWLHYPIESKIIFDLFAHFSILQCRQKPALLFVNDLHPLNSILTKFDVFQLQVWAFTITWLPTVRPAFYESVLITIITVIEEVLFREFLPLAALVPTQKNTDLSQKWTLFLINTATVMKLF